MFMELHCLAANKCKGRPQVCRVRRYPARHFLGIESQVCCVCIQRKRLNGLMGVLFAKHDAISMCPQMFKACDGLLHMDLRRCQNGFVKGPQ